jgi:hypothetical protein
MRRDADGNVPKHKCVIRHELRRIRDRMQRSLGVVIIKTCRRNESGLLFTNMPTRSGARGGTKSAILGFWKMLTGL